MRSVLGPEGVTFGVLQARLIRFVNNRISNGDFSERGLARVLQISQPQLHNVLKGMRKLTPELADHIMQNFEITVLDLLEGTELAAYMACPDSCDQPVTRVPVQVEGAPQAQSLSANPGIPKKSPGSQNPPRQMALTSTA